MDKQEQYNFLRDAIKDGALPDPTFGNIGEWLRGNGIDGNVVRTALPGGPNAYGLTWIVDGERLPLANSGGRPVCWFRGQSRW
jgi:hypothetical protein